MATKAYFVLWLFRFLGVVNICTSVIQKLQALIFIEEATSVWFSYRSSIQVELEFQWRCWFLWREENRRTQRKNLRSKAKANNKLNPHITTEQNRTRSTLMRGERSEHCAIPVSQYCLYSLPCKEMKCCSTIAQSLGDFLNLFVSFFLGSISNPAEVSVGVTG